MADTAIWPELDYARWRDTAMTLQLWTQVVGKVRLALTPWVNHSWQVPLYVTARGLGTSPIPAGHEIVEIDFDFIDHSLDLRSSNGAKRALDLQPQSVAAFYRAVMAALAELGVSVRISDMPNEIPGAIRFSQDEEHKAYDAAAARDFWRALVQSDHVFKHFRSGFLGKVSPVHFFWGSFDLAVTRFSGRRAPPNTGTAPNVGNWVMREAYSHEVSSVGFWPGDASLPMPAFYAYAYPEPEGFARAPIRPVGGYYDETMGEFILPYDRLLEDAAPDRCLLEFCETTYAAAADLGRWNRAELERQ